MPKPNLTKLRDQINEAFDEEELRDLCFELGVDYESLGGRGKAANVREFIIYCQRHHLFSQLQTALTQVRPNINWASIFLPQSPVASPQQQQAWQTATQIYLNKLHEQVNWLYVLGKPEGQPLEYIYTDVNVLDKLSAERRYSLEQLQTEFVPRQGWRQRDKERRDGLQAAIEHQHLFILGKPGAGKTTFLKYVAVQAIQHYRLDNGKGKLPIFISLKELSDSKLPIIPFIVGQFRRGGFADAQAFVQQLLLSGKALVLFDGLDEVSAEEQQRGNLTRDIQYFVDEFDNCRILVTCRLAATDYMLERFEYVEMADFNQDQQQTFVYRWFQTDTVARDACWQALQDTRSETLRELAQVPMLLTLLCLTFEERKEFPPNRDEIYSEATRALLLKWDSKRNIQRDRVYGALTLKFKERMLARIAAQTFEAEDYFIPKRRLARLIERYLEGVPGVTDPDGVFVLQAIEAQHGLLVERAHGIYSFSHLTLQEYFAARYYAENEAGEDSMSRLITYIGNDRWREVFLLTAGLLEEATEFCKQYLEALTKIMASDETLLAVLKGASGQTAAKQIGRRPPAIRALAIYFSLDRAIGSSHEINLARTRALTLAHVLVPSINRDLLFDRNFDLDVTFELDRTLSLSLALDLSARYDPSLLTELPETTSEIIIYLRRWTGKLGLMTLHQALQRLIVPAKNSLEASWYEFNQQLMTIVLTHWELKAFWELSREQKKLLEKYLEANLLLVECMSLAYLPNREELENKLLLPPEPTPN